MNKSEIRSKCRQMRSQMNNDEVAEKSSKIAQWFLKSDLYRNADSIMLYMPIGNEADTGEIIKTAYADGKNVAFPVTDSEYNIVSYYANENTKFETSALSISEPIKTRIAFPDAIDVVIIPGVAFDRHGSRIGFGKGCYDRFLKETNATKIGVCYELQICDKIPSEQYDEKMDYIITEKGIIDTNKEGT